MVARTVAVVVALLALTLSGCGGSKSGAASTPQGTFANLQQSVKAKDFAAIYDMLSAKDMEQLGKTLDEAKQRMSAADPAGKAAAAMMAKQMGCTPEELASCSPRDFFLKMMGSQASGNAEFEKMGSATIEGEPKIEGDKCSVNVKFADGSTDKVKMVQEGGLWKLRLSD